MKSKRISSQACCQLPCAIYKQKNMSAEFCLFIFNNNNNDEEEKEEEEEEEEDEEEDEDEEEETGRSLNLPQQVTFQLKTALGNLSNCEASKG